MLRVAVVGCGLIALKRHLPAFLALHRKCSVVGLCDLQLERAQRAAQDFRIPKAYGEPSAMLSIERPDLVDICTPPATHALLAVEALENGAAVLVEKPMALTMADCNRMIEAASRAGRPLGVLHNQLFNPAFLEARELFSQGELGSFLGMRAWLSTPRAYMTSQRNHWAHQLPGGVLGETGPHAVYLSLAFLKDVREVAVRARKILPDCSWSPFEDFRVDLMGANGTSSVWLSYAGDNWAAEVDLLGTKGGLKIDLQAQEILRYRRPSLTRWDVGREALRRHLEGVRRLGTRSFTHLLGRSRDGHRRGIHHFIHSLMDGASPLFSPEMGRETVRVMEMIVERLQEVRA